MYLWKYWRESRIIFYAGLFGVLVLLILGFKDLTVSETGSTNGHVVVSRKFGEMLGIVLVVIPYLQAVPFGFLAWLLGSCGVGRDLGERSGSYLLSRPRNRAYFVWCDWVVGITMLLLLSVLLNAGLWLQVHQAVLFVNAAHSELSLPGAIPLRTTVLTTWASAFLLSALIFSVTYFFTVVMKHSRGIILGGGLLVGYIVLKIILQHYWPGIELPELMMQQYKAQFRELADHLWISAAFRAGVLLLFPLAAQFVLEKADV